MDCIQKAFLCSLNTGLIAFGEPWRQASRAVDLFIYIPLIRKLTHKGHEFGIARCWLFLPSLPLLHGWPRLRPSFLQESEEPHLETKNIHNFSLSLCVCLQDRMQIMSTNSQRTESASPSLSPSVYIQRQFCSYLINKLVKSLEQKPPTEDT